MIRALDLLKNSDLSVDEIAAKVGYDSKSAFSRIFKSCMGVVTPGNCRRAGDAGEELVAGGMADDMELESEMANNRAGKP